MALNIFFPSSTGMEAQSHAIGQVGTNIANISTVGYRTNKTMFYTLLGANPTVKGNQVGVSSSHSDIEGVGYYDRTNMSQYGVVTRSGGNYDVAINGTPNAFFWVKDSYNHDYYTRAGNFSTLTQGGVTYLVNQNGLKVQGFPGLESGGFGAGTEDIVIKYPEKIPPKTTTEATITANVPADGVDSASYGITVYAPGHEGETLHMLFQKVEGKANAWNLSFSLEDGTAVGTATEVIFSSKGEIETPKNLSVAVNWNDGVQTNVALDISNMTQLAGGTGTTYVKQNGAPSGNFEKSYIGEDGVVKAYYSNGDTYNIAKLAVVGFTSEYNLTPISGTLFEANASTGDNFFVEDAELVPQSLESSTVNIEQEFGDLVVIQRAYTLNSNAFTTADEMLQTAIDLKS